MDQLPPTRPPLTRPVLLLLLLPPVSQSPFPSPLDSPFSQVLGIRVVVTLNLPILCPVFGNGLLVGQGEDFIVKLPRDMRMYTKYNSVV